MDILIGYIYSKTQQGYWMIFNNKNECMAQMAFIVCIVSYFLNVFYLWQC